LHFTFRSSFDLLYAYLTLYTSFIVMTLFSLFFFKVSNMLINLTKLLVILTSITCSLFMVIVTYYLKLSTFFTSNLLTPQLKRTILFSYTNYNQLRFCLYFLYLLLLSQPKNTIFFPIVHLFWQTLILQL